jgi:tol-pal system protein YbgF
MSKRLLLLVSLGILFTGAMSAGTKEEIVRLQSDVLQLQNQIRLLEKMLTENNGTIVSLLEQLNDQSAESKVQFDQLISGMAVTRTSATSVEETLNQMRDEIQLLSTKLDETNGRVAALHRKLEDNQMQVQTLRTASSEPGQEVEPDRVYSASYNDYLMGNYALAVDGFQDFLANFPDSEYADNAAYYLGDCYVKQGKHELAIQAFEQVINLYPDADKTPTAYYKKAVALEQLQRLEQAIDTLKRLEALFPNAPEAQLARDELVKLGVASSE